MSTSVWRPSSRRCARNRARSASFHGSIGCASRSATLASYATRNDDSTSSYSLTGRSSGRSQRFGERGQCAVDLVVADDERWHEPDHVAFRAARHQHDVVLLEAVLHYRPCTV